jgi:hypothetical protein
VFAHLTPKDSPRRTAIDSALGTYERARPELEATHRGYFALAKGDIVLGVFARSDDAALEARRVCGEWDYVIREIGAPPLGGPLPQRDSARRKSAIV